jgi:hypothetical protein
MKFKEILNRLTGISTPIFGVSWNPLDLEVTVARRVIVYLQDRRVLYNPYDLEVPEHCIESVLEIRRFLTSELDSIRGDSELSKNLQAMQAACRKFLNRQTGHEFRILRYRDNNVTMWSFLTALGELRGVFGIHLAQIAAKYGLDIAEPLASILPAGNESSAEV